MRAPASRTRKRPASTSETTKTAAPAEEGQAPLQDLVLDETLDLAAASELARTLTSLRGSAISIDPSQVGRVGAQCVQVLISASKTWSADGVAFAVKPGSEPFEEGLKLLGLTSFFSSESAH